MTAAFALSTERFHWDGKRKRFTADESDLGPSPYRVEGRTVVLHLRSEKTGQIVPFLRYAAETNPEGEVLYWRFRPNRTYTDTNPNLKGAEVWVFND